MRTRTHKHTQTLIQNLCAARNRAAQRYSGFEKNIKKKYYACAQSLLHFLSFVSPVIFSQGEFEGGRITKDVSGTSCLLICPLGPTFHKSRRIRRFFCEEAQVNKLI